MTIKRIFLLVAAVIVMATVGTGCSIVGAAKPGDARYKPPMVSDIPMKPLFEEAVRVIKRYAREELRDVSPAKTVFVPSGQDMALHCGPQPYEDIADNAAYCNANKTIYVGEGMLWRAYGEAGKIGVFMILGHEFGHRIQSQRGMLQFTPIVPIQSQAWKIAMENQADCYSGALVAYAHTVDTNVSPYGVDLHGLFLDLGSSPYDPFRDHGTPQERFNAFWTGVYKGAASC